MMEEQDEREIGHDVMASLDQAIYPLLSEKEAAQLRAAMEALPEKVGLTSVHALFEAALPLLGETQKDWIADLLRQHMSNLGEAMDLDNGGSDWDFQEYQLYAMALQMLGRSKAPPAPQPGFEVINLH